MGKAKDYITSERKDVSNVFISGLAFELKKLALNDIKKGKLDPSKPYDLKPNADRLIRAWRGNPLTGSVLMSLGTTDVELTQMMKDVLTEVGVVEIKE